MGKITLTAAQSLPLDKLVASDANVRRIKAGVSLEQLAEDICRRGLLQSLNVRPVLDGGGAETGRYAVTAGGHRFAALKLLVKGKRLARNAAVPCIVKDDGAAEEDSRSALFAYCAARTLNATHQPYDRRPAALAHASRIAEALSLDMSAQWTATKDGYLGRVTKAQILAAVREAKGEAAAQLIDHLKKGDMAEAAERVLVGTGWLPALLRTPGLQTFAAAGAADAGPTSGDDPTAADLPAFLTDHDEIEAGEVNDVDRVYAVAAE